MVATARSSLITPALVGSRAAHWASDLDEGIELARQRMELSLIAIKALGLRARGEVGDADPNLAIEDALRGFAADEVLISTLPAEKSRWLEHDVVRRAREEVDLPVTHVVVDLEAEAAREQNPALSIGFLSPPRGLTGDGSTTFSDSRHFGSI